MNKRLIVKQDGYKECGASCLLSIIKYYGGDISINKLLELTHTDKDGTSFYNIKEAALKVGLEAVGYNVNNKDDLRDFEHINLPSICQIISNGYEHFVVLYRINNSKVLLMDPACGYVKMAFEEFVTKWTGHIMTFSKTRQLPCVHDNRYLTKIIIDLLINNKSIVLNIILLSIIFTVISCVYAMYGGLIIDNVIETTKNNLLFITLIFGIFLIVKCITGFFRNELFIYLNQKLDCSIFLNAFRKILLLPYSYYKNKTTGEVISRINDLVYVKGLISKIILTVFLDLIISVGCGIVLLFINKVMFMLLILTILIYVIIFYLFRRFQKKYIEINQENNALINSSMIEVISGFETVKNLNLESMVNDKVTSLYVRALNDIFIFDNMNNLESFIKDIVTGFSVLMIEFIGFNLVFDNMITLGEIIIFTSLINYFISPVRNIIDLNKEYYYAINSLKRANDLFDVESTDLVSKTNFNINGNIKINNLSFSYNDYNLILKDVNFNINKGEKILFLGESGSGKSTILKILVKFFKVRRDYIYFDGVDINDISISNIRDNVVLISQDEIIFTDTIRNNILLDRKIDEKTFVNVCKMLYVDEIVKDKFLGYDTKLEENGLNISGGQRQRIILARAFLKKFNILLIDEGLNAMDINLERKILKNIFKEFKDKTMIIISHRLENTDLYDKVFRISDGKIVDVVTYSEGGTNNV